MFTKNWSLLCVAAAVVIVSLFGVTSAQAATVNLVNPSFEQNVIPAGQDWLGGVIPTGWTQNPGAGATVTLNNTGNPQRFPLGMPSAQAQMAYASTGGAFSQVYSTQTFEADTVYTFSGWGGMDKTGADGGYANCGGQLVLQGSPDSGTTWTSLVTLNWAADEAPVGGFSQKSGTYSTGASGGVVGSSFKVLWIVANVSGNHMFAADDIQLTSSPIPEPGSLIMLSAGLLGLLCYAWRKRK